MPLHCSVSYDMPLFLFNHSGNLHYTKFCVWRLSRGERSAALLKCFVDTGHLLVASRGSKHTGWMCKVSHHAEVFLLHEQLTFEWDISLLSGGCIVPGICLCTGLVGNAYGS